jgi:septal ring factor EnvC (AmiA/AmiB activator)
MLKKSASGVLASRRGSTCQPVRRAAPRSIQWGLAGLALLLTTGCATTKDLDTLQTQLSEQVAAVRVEAAQSRQAVEALKTDILLLKSLGIAVDNLKNRFDATQTTLQGVAKETDRLRTNVGALDQGLAHQLQMEMTLARERVKQLEQLIDSLKKSGLIEKDKSETAMPKP